MAQSCGFKSVTKGTAVQVDFRRRVHFAADGESAAWPGTAMLAGPRHYFWVGLKEHQIRTHAQFATSPGFLTGSFCAFF